jgi:hypothetical protein
MPQENGFERKGWTVVGPNGERALLSYTGPEPTQEEADFLKSVIFGEGLLTRQHLPGAGAAAGSILGTEAAKRSFARRAGQGIQAMGMKGARRALGFGALAAGAGGLIGEGFRGSMVPETIPRGTSKVTGEDLGRFNVLQVTEPQLMGLGESVGIDDISWRPGSTADRFKMMGLAGLKEAGLEGLGGGIMRGLGSLGRGMFRQGMSSPGGPMPEILAGSRNPRGGRWGTQRESASRGSTGLEDIMRLGDEGRIGSTGFGRAAPGRVPRERKTMPDGTIVEEPPSLWPGRQGRYPLGRTGTRATEAGWGQYKDLARAMEFSAQEARRIVSPIKGQKVLGMDAVSLSQDIMGAGAPKGRTLEGWLKINDTSGLLTGKVDPGEINTKLTALFERYIVGRDPTSGRMVAPQQAPTLGNVMDDIAFLEGHLDQIYNMINDGTAASAPAQLLVAKAIKEALSSRVGRTIQQTAPDLFEPWQQQRSVSRVMGNALDLTKGSSDTMLTGMMLGAAALGGGTGASLAGVTAAIPGAAIAAGPAALMGGVPPLSAKVGQQLFSRRLSTLPQQVARGTTVSLTPGQPTPETAPPSVAQVLEAAGGSLKPTGSPDIPLIPVGPDGQPYTTDQMQQLLRLLPGNTQGLL